MPYASIPLAGAFIEPDTFILRSAVVKAPFAVPAVLHIGNNPQVYLAVVKAVAVNVVNDSALRGIHNPPVHKDISAAFGADCIKVIFVLILEKIPFIFVQFFEILNIDNGVFALREPDTPEFIAIADFSIAQQKCYAKAN
jgi:hypothetical protein